MQIKFGYYPRHCDIHIKDISIVDLPDQKQIVTKIEKSRTIHKDWLYAPPCQKEDFFSGKTNTLPYNHRIFGLPKTHILTHNSADIVDHLDFLVWCFGFFTGMRLTTTEAGFLDATPIKPGKLTDFILSNCTLSDAISLSETFWQKHYQDNRKVKRIVGIIHTLFLAQYPINLDFERFTYLYNALDACFKLTKSVYEDKGSPSSHAKRIHWMCDIFEMETPDWALLNANDTEISVVRNKTFHESLFFEEPLGFAIYDDSKNDNVLLEMEALICRLIIALLGKPKCNYVKTPVNTRQIHGCDLT